MIFQKNVDLLNDNDSFALLSDASNLLTPPPPLIHIIVPSIHCARMFKFQIKFATTMIILVSYSLASELQEEQVERGDKRGIVISLSEASGGKTTCPMPGNHKTHHDEHERECPQMRSIMFTNCLLPPRANAISDENIMMLSSLSVGLFMGYPYTSTQLQEDHHALSAGIHPYFPHSAYSL